MKDMFYNYDNNIDTRPISGRGQSFFEPDRLLSSDPNISIIKDIKGKEIGVKVKQGMPFTLYFYLDDYSTSIRVSDIEDICDLVYNSTTKFEIITAMHEVVATILFNTADIFKQETSELIISVDQETANLLQKDSYRLRLTLDLGFETYEVYSEADGLLIVR